MSITIQPTTVAACTAVLFFLGLVACRESAKTHEVVNLIDHRHLPDVLVDSRSVDRPPTFSGNRFLRGWWPWKHKGVQVLVPSEEGAWLELANLGGRNRKLILDLEFLGDSGDYEVGIEVAGDPQPSVPLADPLEIPLPGHLPLGRTPVKLVFPKIADPVVVEAKLDSAFAPGEVDFSADGISQSPTSLIDFVRLVAAGATLHGRFDPPTDPGDDQHFSITLAQDQDLETTVFEWPEAGWKRFLKRREFSIALADEASLVRIRFTAKGTGSAGIWHDLRLESPSSEVTTVSPSPPSPPRLVVVYVLDALRGDFVDLSSPESSLTPTLSRLASEGVVFRKHQSVAPNTIPSTKSLFTGQTFLTKGHAVVPVDGPETLAEAFSSAGYRTAAFSGNGYVSEAFGTSRGFEHLAEEVVFQEYADSNGAYNDNAEQVHHSALQWLDQLGRDEQAFVYLHTIHPHNPYDPPDSFQKRYVPESDSTFKASTSNLLHVKHRRKEIDDQDRERIRGLYKGAVAYNDERIANLLAELETRFLPEEILLIITSDHGEELFDHGGVLHGYTLYQEQLQIPLILWWPGHLEPRAVDNPTLNVDIHEALRSLVGASPSAFDDGRDLWALAFGEGRPADPFDVRFAAASSVKGGIFLAQSDRYKLIQAPRVGLTFGMGEGLGRSRDPEYVFDLINDPAEQHNIAGVDSIEIAWLRSLLGAWIERGRVLEMGEGEPDLDENTQKQLRALGYLD